MDLKKIFEKYTEIHLEELKKVEQILDKKSIEFKISINIDSDFSKFKIKNVLYYFEIPLNFSAQEICEIINKEKKEKSKEIKFPKVNFGNAEIPNNKILYVGKSSGYFSTRLKQHIGKESKKTYALHLNEWKNLFDKDVKLNLFYISFDEIDNNLLELIETSLHYELKPILGRTGH